MKSGDIAFGVLAFAVGIALGLAGGAEVEHQAMCPKFTNRVVARRTIETPALVMQNGVWMYERRVAETWEGQR